ncbi:MAG: hypothetical protein ACYDC3_20520, partial [Candidatus Binataceae bacterium]
MSANVTCARALGAAIAILAWCVAWPAMAQQPVDRVLASVDGDPITAHDVQAFSIAMGHPVNTNDMEKNPDAKLALKELIAAKLFQ